MKTSSIMNFLVKTIITTFAVVITAYLLGGVTVDDFVAALVVAFVLGVLNMVLKPLLIILTIPVTIMSFGLFLLVINAFIIQLSAYVVPGFEVRSFWWALLFGIILSLVRWVLELPVRPRDRHPQRDF